MKKKVNRYINNTIEQLDVGVCWGSVNSFRVAHWFFFPATMGLQGVKLWDLCGLESRGRTVQEGLFYSMLVWMVIKSTLESF